MATSRTSAIVANAFRAYASPAELGRDIVGDFLHHFSAFSSNCARMFYACVHSSQSKEEESSQFLAFSRKLNPIKALQ